MFDKKFICGCGFFERDKRTGGCSCSLFKKFLVSDENIFYFIYFNNEELRTGKKRHYCCYCTCKIPITRQMTEERRNILKKYREDKDEILKKNIQKTEEI